MTKQEERKTAFDTAVMCIRKNYDKSIWASLSLKENERDEVWEQAKKLVEKENIYGNELFAEAN